MNPIIKVRNTMGWAMLMLMSAFILIFGMGDGCDNTDRQDKAKEFNQNSLANAPEIIGKIDGQPLKRYVLENPDGNYYHYIYVIGNQVTADNMYRVGKQTRVSVQAILAEDPKQLDFATKVKLETLQRRIQDCQTLLDTLQSEVTNVLSEAH